MRPLAAFLCLVCLEAVVAGSARGARLRSQDRRILQAAAVSPGSLSGRQAYFSEESRGGNIVLVLPNAAAVLAPFPGGAAAPAAPSIGTAEDCSAVCRQTANCSAFWFCGLDAGCPDGAGGTLPPRSCVPLSSSSCGGVPLTARRSPGSVGVTSGFPVGPASALPAGAHAQATFGQSIEGLGIRGADIPCDGSLLPGSCVLGSLEEAAALCAAAPTCQAVVQYRRGLDGCSAPVAVLQSATLAGNGSFVDPSVATYVRQAAPVGAAVGGDSASSAGACSGGLSAGAVAGIAVGASLLSAALGGLLVWAVMARQQGRRAQSCSIGKSESNHSEYLAGGPEDVQCAPENAPDAPPPRADQGPRSSINSPPLSGALSASNIASGEIIPELVQAVAAADVQRYSIDIRRASADVRRFSVDRRRSIECRMAAMARLPPRLREWVVDLRHVEYLTGPTGEPLEIGAGASASVFLARFHGEIVAAKEIDIGMSQLNRDTFIQEAVSLHALRHQNVVAFYGLSIAGKKGVVLCEYCEGRDLYRALEIRGQTASGTSERVFGWRRRGRRVALDVARALNYLHSKGIVHMDLKSPNVLLTAAGTAKICDVGFSRVKQNGMLQPDNLQIGTFAWAAPEVLMGKPCTQSVDIYSMGVLMWELITGERPQRGNLRLPRVPEECGQDTCDLMLRCLKEDPAARPSAEELMRALGEDQRRRTNQAGGCGLEAPGRPAGVAVSAPPPPAAASPFANASPATTAPPSTASAPPTAASPFANTAPVPTGSAFGSAAPVPAGSAFGNAPPAPAASPVGNAPPAPAASPFGDAPPAAAASPFGNAAPAAEGTPAADGKTAAPAIDASPVARWPSATLAAPPAKNASADPPATPTMAGLEPATSSPFVFANGVAGAAASSYESEGPGAPEASPRPVLTDQSHIARGSTFNHASFPCLNT